jgi:hypothetical protein
LNVSVEVKKELGDISLGGRNPAFSLFLSFFAFLTNQLGGGRERAWLAGLLAGGPTLLVWILEWCCEV